MTAETRGPVARGRPAGDEVVPAPANAAVRSLRIVRAEPQRIPELEPLWRALHEHHVVVEPLLHALGPLPSSDALWKCRKALYEEWLREPGGFALIAECDDGPIGYAMVHMRPVRRGWPMVDRVALLETISVLPAYRSRGVGLALMDALRRELDTLGVSVVEVSVWASNLGAIRFYERSGFRRGWTTLVASSDAIDAPPG